MHELLKEQLKAHFGALDRVPPEMLALMEEISNTYIQKETDLLDLEQNLDAASSNLMETKKKTSNDVTRRKDAEIEAKKAVSLLESALDSTADGILVVDLRGNIVRFNRRFADLWRVPTSIMESARGGRLQQHMHTMVEDPDRFLKKVRKVLTEPDLESVDIVTLRDGRVFERCSLPQILDGKPVGRVWSFRDITQKQRAEEAQRDSEERFKAFMDKTPSLAWIKDEMGQYLYINAPFERTFDTRMLEFLGSTDHDIFPVEVADSLRESDQLVLASGETIENEISATLPDGTPHSWLFLRFRLQASKERCFIAGIGIDITERKKLQDQLRQSQKMEAIGQLAGGISHDFNNLLSGIVGFSELTLKDIEADHPCRTYIEEVHKAGTRAANLTGKLLAFSRRQVLQPKILNMNTVVEGMDNMLRRLIGEHIQLGIKVDPYADRVKIDPGQLEQVILNLTVNARDAMPEGGEVVVATGNRVRHAPFANRNEIIPPGNYVTLSVTDQGSGMSKHTLQHLFEPFFTTKATGKGTGLGLATVYGIIKQSGGYILIDTEEGTGSTFTILLPSEGPTEQTKIRRKTEVIEKHGQETILLVEDEETVRLLASKVLRKSGYHVMVAGNGREALDLFLEHADAIDLVVSDVVMPEMGGGEMAQKIHSSRPEARIMFMSGYNADSGLQLALSDDEISILQKPFTPEMLLGMVREKLDGPFQKMATA